jgi:hypothetical protein
MKVDLHSCHFLHLQCRRQYEGTNRSGGHPSSAISLQTRVDLKATGIEYILMDINMPVMDGDHITFSWTFYPRHLADEGLRE